MPTSIQITAPVGYGTNETLFRDHPKGAIQNASQQSGLPTAGTHDPANSKLMDINEIVPYATKLNSPVRVTFTPGTLSKHKSRIADQSKSAIFNYKPLRRADSKNLLSRFRPPDATLTTLQHLSPWLSVSRSDFRDPRLESELAYDDRFDEESLRPLKSGLFRRSFTEGQIDLSRIHVDERPTHDVCQDISLAEASINPYAQKLVTFREGVDSKSIPTAKLLSREHSITKGDTTILRKDSRQSVSALSLSADEEITNTTINEDSIDEREFKERNIHQRTPAGNSSPRMANGNRNIPTTLINKASERKVNYYSGYLPPELCKEIAEQWKIRSKSGSMPPTPDPYVVVPNSYLHKPLVGDRSFYLQNSYPITRRYCRSDIDVMRLEGRKKLLQSYGHAPAHYSALKFRDSHEGQRSVILDEAVREEQIRQSATNRRKKPAVTHAKSTDFAMQQNHPEPATDKRTVITKEVKAPPKTMEPLPVGNQKQGLSSMDKFQMQRERTYHLQSLAREMLSR